MLAQNHPQFDTEQEQLTKTLKHIQEKLDYGLGDGGAQREASRLIADMQKQTLKEMQEARQSAYFGRVDVKEEGEIDTYYIGKYLLLDVNVFSWAADKISKWYYKKPPAVLLKRVFQIDYENLLDIKDDYIDPSLGDEILFSRFEDPILQALLKKNKGGQLRDIVATIQAQQYDIISSSLDQVLVIQGVAGSGKSAIALHRIAYLLHNNRQELKNILMLGPNRMFMGYVEQVLPSLGEHTVVQQSVDDWLLQILGGSFSYASADDLLELLLSSKESRKRKETAYLRSHLKGSLKMMDLLETYIQVVEQKLFSKVNKTLECKLVQEVLLLDVDLKIRETIKYSPEQIKVLLAGQQQMPVNKRRDELEKSLVNNIVEDFLQKIADRVKEEGGRSFNINRGTDIKVKIEEKVKPQVTKYFNEWRKENALTVYRQMLNSLDTSFQKFAQAILNDNELKLLASGSSLDAGDLAPLVYLKILLDGVDDKKLIDHLVIDEAQDLSLLHFIIFSRFMSKPSITILGDTAQGIYTYSGIERWVQLKELFSTQFKVESVQQAYRSTKEITDYANALLQRVGVAANELAVPLARNGSLPITHALAEKSKIGYEIGKIILEEQQIGRRSIAVICKTVEACKFIAQQLKNSGIEDYQLLTDRNAKFTNGIVVIPVYLTKGLEFDSAIIADAQASSYPANKLNAKLLYVALTRAAQSLHICYSGQISPLLEPDVTKVDLETSQSAQDCTLAEYVAKNPHLDLVKSVEYLSALKSLHLLKEGRIKQLLLDAFFTDQLLSSDSQAAIASSALTEENVRRWTQAIEGMLNSDGNKNKEVLVRLIYGIVSNQTRSKLQQKQPSSVEPKTFTDQAVELFRMFQPQAQLKMLVKPKWVGRTELMKFVEPSDHARAEELIVKLIDQGFLQEQISAKKEYPSVQMTHEKLPSLLELAVQQYRFPSV